MYVPIVAALLLAMGGIFVGGLVVGIARGSISTAMGRRARTYDWHGEPIRFVLTVLFRLALAPLFLIPPLAIIAATPAVRVLAFASVCIASAGAWLVARGRNVVIAAPESSVEQTGGYREAPVVVSPSPRPLRSRTIVIGVTLAVIGIGGGGTALVLARAAHETTAVFLHAFAACVIGVATAISATRPRGVVRPSPAPGPGPIARAIRRLPSPGRAAVLVAAFLVAVLAPIAIAVLASPIIESGEVLLFDGAIPGQILVVFLMLAALAVFYRLFKSVTA